MPGDTLYIKFTSDCSGNDWGYRFTVTGGNMGRFDTGYLILNAVLSLPECVPQLPIEKLWAALVCVCCKQTGQQRLRWVVCGWGCWMWAGGVVGGVWAGMWAGGVVGGVWAGMWVGGVVGGVWAGGVVGGVWAGMWAGGVVLVCACCQQMWQ